MDTKTDPVKQEGAAAGGMSDADASPTPSVSPSKSVRFADEALGPDPGPSRSDGAAPHEETVAAKATTASPATEPTPAPPAPPGTGTRRKKLRPNFHAHGRKFRFAPRALGCIPITNPLRRACAWLITSRPFETTILTLITINSLVLGLVDFSSVDPETYELDSEVRLFPRPPLHTRHTRHTHCFTTHIHAHTHT